MNGMTKLRVSFLGLGFGVALMLAPAALAQADANPDHFTATGVELGPGGNVSRSAAPAATPKQASKPKPVAVSAAQVNSSPAPVHVAVADKNRQPVATEPKR